MSKKILLVYPDQTPNRKIIDDLIALSRNTGQKCHRAVATFDKDDTALSGMSTVMVQRGIPYNDADAATAALSSTQAIVEDGVAIEITGGSVEFTVEDGAITGGAFTETP